MLRWLFCGQAVNGILQSLCCISQLVVRRRLVVKRCSCRLISGLERIPSLFQILALACVVNFGRFQIQFFQLFARGLFRLWNDGCIGLCCEILIAIDVRRHHAQLSSLCDIFFNMDCCFTRVLLVRGNGDTIYRLAEYIHHRPICRHHFIGIVPHQTFDSGLQHVVSTVDDFFRYTWRSNNNVCHIDCRLQDCNTALGVDAGINGVCLIQQCLQIFQRCCCTCRTRLCNCRRSGLYNRILLAGSYNNFCTFWRQGHFCARFRHIPILDVREVHPQDDRFIFWCNCGFGCFLTVIFFLAGQFFLRQSSGINTCNRVLILSDKASYRIITNPEICICCIHAIAASIYILQDHLTIQIDLQGRSCIHTSNVMPFIDI